MHRHTLYMQVLASSRLKNRGDEVLCDLREGRKTVYKHNQVVYISCFVWRLVIICLTKPSTPD